MKKHLLFHMHLAPGHEWHLELLNEFKDIFDGERIVAISVGGSEPIRKGRVTYANRRPKVEGRHLVPEALNLPEGLFTKIIYTENSNLLREVKTWPLLLSLCPSGEGDIAFFCHSKGTARKRDERTHFKEEKYYDRQTAVLLWTRLMYGLALKKLELVEGSFNAGAKMLGSLKRHSMLEIPGLGKGFGWHYSGTFFWFDVREMKKRFEAKKSRLMPHRLGLEALPGQLFNVREAASIFGDEGGEALIGELRDCGAHTDKDKAGSMYDLDKVEWIYEQLPEWAILPLD